LLGLGHSVAIIDELNDFYPPAFKERNLAEVRARGPVDFRQADICDAEAVAGFLKPNPPDAVIHLAARAGVRPSLERPL
jgi:UDP-glucuronate 4-epimerase